MLTRFDCRAVWLCAWLVVPVTGQGQAFEVSGSLTLQSLTQGWTHTQHFEMAVSGCRALISSSNTDIHSGYMAMRPGDGVVSMTNGSDRIAHAVGIDNGTTYRLTRFYHDGKCSTAASIEPFEVSRDEISGINYLWYAFASSCYFRQQTNEFLEPIWTLDDAELKRQHFKERAEWSLHKNPPFLPHKVAYYSDGLLRHRTGGVASTNRAPAPYDHGFTHFTYETLASTNVGGIEVPQEFRFIRYSFPKTTKLAPIWVVTGKIDHVSPGTSVSVFRPPFSGTITIVDKRYSDPILSGENLIFESQNAEWQNKRSR